MFIFSTSPLRVDDVYDDIDDDDGMDYSDGDEDDAGDGEDMEENDPDESDIVHDDHITLDDDSTLKEEQYECLDRKDIVERQTRVISKVADVLSVPFSTARLLLQAMQVRNYIRCDVLFLCFTKEIYSLFCPIIYFIYLF